MSKPQRRIEMAVLGRPFVLSTPAPIRNVSIFFIPPSFKSKDHIRSLRLKEIVAP
jgi:hypothetical protein